MNHLAPCSPLNATIEGNTTLVAYQDKSLQVQLDEKTVNVDSTERFTKISINKKTVTPDNVEVYIKTEIVKDKLFDTTKTKTKKIFVHKTAEKSNMIIREINTDRDRESSVTEHKRIFVDTDSNENLLDKIQMFLSPTEEAKKVLQN